jgi:hypothetical protein
VCSSGGHVVLLLHESGMMNAHESAARLRKATDLAALWITHSGKMLPDVATMIRELVDSDPDSRWFRTMEDMAGTHRASPTTWLMVADVLDERARWAIIERVERWAAEVPPPPANPFDAFSVGHPVERTE